ncbi:MAG: helix-turn-helix domain-containing protein [Chthoniobacterales bacterium]
MKSSAQNKPTIGAMLSAKREQLGIPVERAAKESRIRAQRLREIESDDFSQLSNASYARMFLIAYAKYLGIPREDLDTFLPEQGVASSDNYQYIHGTSSVLPTIRYEPKPPPSPNKRLVLTIISVIVIGVLVIGGAVVSYLAINLPRITSALESSKPEQEPATPAPTVPPVIPPGIDTVQTVAFESTVSITVSEMIVTTSTTDLTLPDAEPVELPPEDATSEAAATPIANGQNAFTEDMEFLLGSSSTNPPDSEQSAPTN